MLSNNGLYKSTQHVHYMLLFLVLAVNSGQFKFYIVTRSYSSHPLLMRSCLIIDMLFSPLCNFFQLWSKKVSTLCCHRYYNWQVAAPMIMSAVIYLKTLPDVCMYWIKRTVKVYDLFLHYKSVLSLECPSATTCWLVLPSMWLPGFCCICTCHRSQTMLL